MVRAFGFVLIRGVTPTADELLRRVFGWKRRGARRRRRVGRAGAEARQVEAAAAAEREAYGEGGQGRDGKGV